jgi:hypothetical protein
MPNPPRLFHVYASDHARERARERFPGYKAARISDEVRDAVEKGRVSHVVPPGVWNASDPDCWYAWTEDGERVFVCTLNVYGGDTIAVKTVLKARHEWPD